MSSILKNLSIDTKSSWFDCAFEGHYCATIQCTQDIEFEQLSKLQQIVDYGETAPSAVNSGLERSITGTSQMKSKFSTNNLLAFQNRQCNINNTQRCIKKECLWMYGPSINGEHIVSLKPITV